MTLKFISIKSWLLGLCVSLICNFNGFLKIFNTNIQAGSFNPFLAPFCLILIFFIVFILSFIKNNFNSNFSNSYYIITTMLVFVLILFGFSFNNYTTLLRDLIYILILISFYHLIYIFDKNKIINVSDYIISLIFFIGYLFPIISLIFLDHSNDRFGGFILSFPLFGNIYLMLLFMKLIMKFSSKIWILVNISYLIPVVLSGSRTALYIYLLLLTFYMIVSNDRMNKYYINLKKLILGFLIITISFIFFFEIAYFSYSSLRVFDFSDQIYGSINTRTIWLMTIIEKLSLNYFVGGFGSGSSENLIYGFLPHFDILRFWYDYSIFFLFLMMLFFLKNFYTINYKMDFHGFIMNVLLILIILIMSTHNAFQDPGVVLLISSMLYIFKKELYLSGK